MQISIEPTTKRTRDPKTDKLIVNQVFLIRDGNKVVGEEKTRGAAEKAAKEYKEVSGPLSTMLYTIEDHTRRVRDEDDKQITEKGFLLRGNDGKFAEFSTDRQTLVDVVIKSGGKMQSTAKDSDGPKKPKAKAKKEKADK